MANWIHQEKVGLKEGTKEAFFDLDEVVFIAVEEYTSEGATEPSTRMFLRFKQEFILQYNREGVGHKSNQWTVYDKETQDKIRKMLMGKVK